VLFLLLVLLLGLFALQELGAVNHVSAEIRDRWLESTRLLGDLNNYTSDARAAEASRLLAQSPAQASDIDHDIAGLRRTVARADTAYRRIAHDPEEKALYARFSAAWQAYVAQEDRVLDLSRQGDGRAAIALFRNGSRPPFEAASDALGALTNRTVALAADAHNEAVTTYKAARALILLVIILAGICLIAAVNYIGRHITEPILTLAARMRSLAARDVSVEIEGAHRLDEIGEMARAVTVFKRNAVELAQSQKGLVQQALMLEERLEAEQRLTALQRNFVLMASHEFRTPLTIIDGHAQRLIALQTRLSPEDVVLRAGKIRRTVRQMTDLIENLLNSSRLFEGDAALYFHPRSIELARLLSEVCSLHREISPEAKITEHYEGAPETLFADYDLLFQAFSNLLSNAVKYSPDGGDITVTVAEQGRCVHVVVQDRGIGIPSGDKAQVFDRFHRGGNVVGVVGTGIGLYLVKMVVDLHGGSIGVESRVGHGSTFTVRLPRRARARSKAAAERLT
jgi:signal transduction histidine kinase